MLFGPGVIDETNENINKAKNVAVDMASTNLGQDTCHKLVLRKCQAKASLGIQNSIDM